MTPISRDEEKLTDEELATLESLCRYTPNSPFTEIGYRNLLRALSELRRLRSPSATQEWRDIKDAPKDGTWILGWASSDISPYRISWGRNHRDALAWCTSFSSFIDGYITHWKPLEPPK